MNRIFPIALAMVSVGTTFGATINLSTGVASWQVFAQGNGGFISAIAVGPNGAWAPAPTGSSWVSYGALQSTSCTGVQVPGNGCANANINPAGDTLTYTLTVSAASLGATSGILNYIFGSDSRVNLFVGNNTPYQNWGGTAPTGNGFNPLGCSGTPVTNAGNTQATYNNCLGTVTFNAANLNGDGSLTLTAYSYNDPIACAAAACGNPTGFILEGFAVTGSVTPEPATFGLVGMASLVGLAVRRMKNRVR